MHYSHTPYSLIDKLPLTVQTAIDEIERCTGLKALVLVGGPEPAYNGRITTHVYGFCLSSALTAF